MNKISVKINGIRYEREIDSGMRLLDFIREEIKLKGVKEGCGEGECGACTVILNGNAVNSCIIYAASIDGAEIITIEGIGGKELDPIQRAFIDAGAVQCGYCTPGMILSAKALLDKNPEASEEEIRAGISGNLCRCTGYDKIVKGVLLAKKYRNKEAGII
jgi:aerobic-type carbon monoxide dehydrogenase small subunit (CoxS/CutS family)